MRVTFYYILKLSQRSFLGSLPWITPTIHDGCQFVCVICFSCQKRDQKPTEQSLAATLFVTKTEKKFSCMAFNQANDQIMRMLKQIVVAGPEVASLVNEFENATECFVYTNESNKPNHEQILSFQESFQTDCRLNSCG